MNSNVKKFLLIAAATFLLVGCEYPYPFTWLTSRDDVQESELTKPSAIPPGEQSGVETTDPLPAPSNNQANSTKQAEGFLPSDCAVNGFSFPNITTGSSDFEPYNGPSLICNSTSTGGNGLNEIHHFDIHAIKPEFVNASFEEQKAVWKPIIDDASAWKEKNPTAGTEVVMIRDDEGGYIYLILTNASIQGCLLGEGHGVEIMDQYLVNYNFSSCEGNSADYLRAIETLQDTARKAIERVEKNKNP